MTFTLPSLPFVVGNGPLPPPDSPRPVDTNPRERKNADLCAVAITSATVLTGNELQFVGLDPPAQKTAFVCTVHRVRAATTQCRHHTGTMVFGGDGYCRPALCSGGATKPFGDATYGLGVNFIASTPTNYGLGTLHRGYGYGIVPFQQPDVYTAVWTGSPGSGVPA